eukprot:TRINITY_DN1869_c0_g1_i1.p1 TRINITY_DN1869_c0_g1~~TRINITY_DN1869_c0_g1_i1.p1  ORF type:complete len:1565 (+),score=427.51 TRINITY_DN1869_c0_g1_i1:17-4711(+)
MKSAPLFFFSLLFLRASSVVLYPDDDWVSLINSTLASTSSKIDLIFSPGTYLNYNLEYVTFPLANSKILEINVDCPSSNCIVYNSYLRFLAGNTFTFKNIQWVGGSLDVRNLKREVSIISSIWSGSTPFVPLTVRTVPSLVIDGCSFSSGANPGFSTVLLNSVVEVSVTNSKFISIDTGGANGGGMNIEKTSNLSMSNNVFRNINAGANGGALYLKTIANTTISSSTFQGCSVTSGGSAIYMHTSTLFVMRDSFVISNMGEHAPLFFMSTNNIAIRTTTVANNQAANYGGGIYLNQKNLLVEDCLFRSNIANRGGAIVLRTTGEITITGSTFESNLAGGYGGAIAANAIIRNSTFNGNAAQFGGAISAARETYNLGLDISNCSFSSNVASNSGGSIYLYGPLALNTVITSSSFSGNSAQIDGGVLCIQGSARKGFSLSDVQMEMNSAGRYGGCIAVFDSSNTGNLNYTFQRINSASNSALSGGFFALSGTASASSFFLSDISIAKTTSTLSGGALHVEIPVNSTVNNVNIDGMNVTNGNSVYGAGIFITGSIRNVSLSRLRMVANSVLLQGGGIRIGPVDSSSITSPANITSLILNDAYFGGCLANLQGGSIYFDENSYMGSVQFNKIISSGSKVQYNGGSMFIGGAIDSFNMNQATILNNNAFNGAGIFVGPAAILGLFHINSTRMSSNVAINSGGGVHIEGTVNNFTVTSSVIYDNGASTGGALFFQSSSYSSINMKGVRMTNHSVSGSGGAILLNGPFELQMSYVNLSSNVAIRGGAIDFTSTSSVSSIQISQSLFRYNHATILSGGVMNLQGSISQVNIAGGYLIDNSANIDGGAIQLQGEVKSLELRDSVVSNNTATRGFGGAIFYQPLDGTLSLFSSNFSHNRIDNDGNGGALFYRSRKPSTFTIDGCNFHNNEAIGSGGALNVQQSLNFTISNSTATENFAGLGGFLYFTSFLSATSFDLENNFLSSNNVTKDGGAIYLSGVFGKSSMRGNHFASNSAVGDGGSMNMICRSIDLEMDECDFSGNKARRGGGLYISLSGSNKRQSSDDNEVTIDGTTFSANEANQAGGLYVVNNGSPDQFQISRTKFDSNNAAGEGGGILVEGSLQLSQIEMNDNAGSSGSAIYTNTPGVIQLKESSINPSSSSIYLGNSESKLIGSNLQSLITCPKSTSPTVGNNLENSCQESVSQLPLPLPVILGVSIGAFVLILLVIIAIVLFVLRKRRYSSFRESTLDFRMSSMELSNVTIGNIIGEGNFGQVYMGQWNGTTVALKNVKVHDEKEKNAWQEELNLLCKLNHPNIIRLLGTYEIEQVNYMVLEYASKGACDRFLQNPSNANKLSNNDLMMMCFDVSKGMTYLEGMGIIHRDLSARNLLLDASLRIKISDFGMSKASGYHTEQTQILPYRWCAPELVRSGISSSQSDVWSFGVCLWEIFSLGKLPYSEMSNEVAIKKVFDEGYRLPIPVRCPDDVYQIMKSTWRINPTERPTFKEIQQKLIDVGGDIFDEKVEESFSDPGIYMAYGKKPAPPPQHNKPPVLSQLASLLRPENSRSRNASHTPGMNA